MGKLTTALGSLALVAIAAIAPSPASAVVYHDTTAGGACHAANGAAASHFTYGNHYVTNVGQTSEYVICLLVSDDIDAGTHSPAKLAVAISSTVEQATVSCSAQTGSYFGGAINNHGSNAQTYTFATAGSSTLTFDTSKLPRQFLQDVVTLNCKMDPGTRLGLIEYWN
jgi:hypothetical protein